MRFMMSDDRKTNQSIDAAIDTFWEWTEIRVQFPYSVTALAMAAKHDPSIITKAFIIYSAEINQAIIPFRIHRLIFLNW